jgi:two-component system, chemotaxis family, response regulator Rcp1
VNLLYVEDNPSDVMLLKAAFRMNEFYPELHIAQDGEEALNWLNDQKAKGEALPDLILLDLNLPRKNGFEVLTVLKGNKELSSIPVIVYTGSTNLEDRAACMRLKADDCWIKPHDFDEALRIAENLKYEYFQFPYKFHKTA